MIMKNYFQRVFLLFVIFTLTNNALKSETINGINVVSIKSETAIFEEWKNPGRYSPVKAFDGKTDTCAAEGESSNSFSIEVKFEKEVDIDEIRVMNGFGKSEDLFKKNNRAGQCSIFFKNKEKLLKREIITLKDQREFQTVKLTENYNTDNIIFSVRSDKIYKGTTYDDTCITEIEFYYKGKKLEINNIEKLQNDYIKRLESRLLKAFADRKYTDVQAQYVQVTFKKDGSVSYSDSSDCGGNTGNVCTTEYVPKYWKIEDLKLYMRNKPEEKWKLTRYGFHYDNQDFDLVLTLDIFKNLEDKDGFSMVDIIDLETVNKRNKLSREKDKKSQ